MAATGQVQDTGQENVLLNLLTTRSDRKDTRLFAHATAETQVAIQDVFTSRPTSRAANVMAHNQDPGFLEVFPRVASRPPKLLQELESMMVDRLRSNDKAASTAVLLTRDRDPGMAANLSLDAHRQVMSSFIAGFSTYTPLLSKAQAELDAALNEGVRCASENVALRVQMASEAERRQKGAAEVRSSIMSAEVDYRKQAFSKLQETRERTARLLKRAAAMEKDLAEARSEEARLRVQVAQLQSQAATLAAITKQEQSWAGKPTSQALATMTMGPITAEDEAFLEAEYTSTGRQRPSGLVGASSGLMTQPSMLSEMASPTAMDAALRDMGTFGD